MSTAECTLPAAIIVGGGFGWPCGTICHWPIIQTLLSRELHDRRQCLMNNPVGTFTNGRVLIAYAFCVRQIRLCNCLVFRSIFFITHACPSYKADPHMPHFLSICSTISAYLWRWARLQNYSMIDLQIHNHLRINDTEKKMTLGDNLVTSPPHNQS